MKVRMLQSVAGPRFNAAVGEVIEFTGEEAHRLIAGGIAEPFKRQRARATETATPPDPETPEGGQVAEGREADSPTAETPEGGSPAAASAEVPETEPAADSTEQPEG